jgi:hypothetical protein
MGNDDDDDVYQIIMIISKTQRSISQFFQKCHCSRLLRAQSGNWQSLFYVTLSVYNLFFKAYMLYIICIFFFN